MKKYSAKTYFQYKEDVRIDRQHDLDSYLSHVISIANTFPRDSVAIGTLDINDLIQAGNEGLVVAWSKVDWDRIENSPNSQGELWSFLKRRIKWSIRREIDKSGMIISTPINKLEGARNKLDAQNVEKILVNVFPKFFDNEVVYNINAGPYISMLLEEIINDELYSVERNMNNIDILLKFYGIGFEQTGQKDLAIEYNTNHGNIQKIIQRTRNKLKTNEFKNLIENFYKNMS